MQIGQFTYEAGRLSAMRQFHVTRRLLPVMSVLLPLAKQGKTSFDDDALVAVTEGLTKLNDVDAEYVINTLLSVVKRSPGSGLPAADILALDGKTLMFPDIDMPTMLRLAWFSLQANMAGFLSALPSALQSANQTQNGLSSG